MISWIDKWFAIETPRHIGHGLGRVLTSQIYRVRMKNVEIYKIFFGRTQKHRFICTQSQKIQIQLNTLYIIFIMYNV